MELCKWSVYSFLLVTQISAGKFSSDFGLSSTQLIRKYKYPLKVYSNIKTEDGYLLDIYRIPYGKTNSNRSGTPILLVHGLLGSSKDFVVMGPEKGLAFILAEQGYDVWLANCRGTQYSRKHVKLNPNTDTSYWTYSIHDIGVYDIPAFVNHILKITNKEKLSYIGFSQGTTSFFILTSSKPEFNDKFSVMVSLAPVAYMENMFSPLLRFMAQFEPVFTILVQMFGFREFPPKGLKILIVLGLRMLSRLTDFIGSVSAIFFYNVGGYSPLQANKEIFINLASDIGECSIYQPLHYAQCIISGEFKPFDWGPRMNLEKYGSLVPPNYNISNIRTSIAMIYSENDWLSSHKDVKRLHENLPNPVYFHKVNDYEFNHFDMMFGNDAKELVFNHLLILLDKFNTNN